MTCTDYGIGAPILLESPPLHVLAMDGRAPHVKGQLAGCLTARETLRPWSDTLPGAKCCQQPE